MTTRRAIAGIDGSRAAEAVSQGAELTLVHAFVWPLFPVPLGPTEVAPGLRAGADKIVAEPVELARKLEQVIMVTGYRSDGFPAPVLIHASE